MKKYIALGLSLILIILIITGCEAKKVEEVTDAEKISLEYNISKENKFVYANYEKIVDILDTNGIIYFGYPEDEHFNIIVEILAEVTKKENIAIYYFNPKKLTDKNSENYQNLIERLNQKDIIAPAVYFVKDKNIVDREISLSKKEDHEDLSNQDKKDLKKIYQEKVKEFLQNKIGT